jgi:hypothetical protein
MSRYLASGVRKQPFRAGGALTLGVLALACGAPSDTPDASPPSPEPGSFAADMALLREHTDVVELASPDGEARVAVAPALQGRVLTSTLAGPSGASLGWVNHELIASGETLQHMNPYGGEDRFWIGPEGGQFSVFFAPGDPFDLEHWFTPAAIDTEPFELLGSDASSARFGKSLRLLNHSGTPFEVEVERTVRLLDRDASAKVLGVELGSELRLVAFASENAIRNAGEEAWTRETGLLSVWILGMFKASPTTTVVIPFEPGPEAERGPVVNTSYFGAIPEERLVIRDGLLFFKGDARYRSKIGIPPRRVRPVGGSFDAESRTLTLVHFDPPEGDPGYVNSMWEIQDEPYGGDVVNSYNDGPSQAGSQLGAFYELETSSPAAALAPGESLSHTHRTFHFQGPEAALDALARVALGAGLEAIEGGLMTGQDSTGSDTQ